MSVLANEVLRLTDPPTVVSYEEPDRTDIGVLAVDTDGSLLVCWSDGHADPAHRDGRRWIWHSEHGVQLYVFSHAKGLAAERLLAWRRAYEIAIRNV